MAIIWKWSLNGNANDSAGSNNGTATNVTYVAWKSGEAGSFNGSSSYINLWAWPSYSNCSISAIVKHNNVTWLQIYYSNWNASPVRIIWIRGNGNKIEWYVNNSTQYWLISNQTISAWVYYNVDLTYDSSTWLFSLYINWVLDNSRSVPTWLTFTWVKHTIWANPDGFSQKMNWVIDEVILKNTLDNVAEIKNKYLYYKWFM